MYITGGIGSTRHGERFTFDYDLPNEEAYAETCAAISLVFFAHRMLQATGDAQYADVMERALYNGVISGVSLKGDRFFYENPLAVYPEATRFHGWTRGTGEIARREWFGCSCCPPNIARFLASFGEYVYMVSDRQLMVNLFAESTAHAKFKGTRVDIEQKTRYPWKGKTVLKIHPEAPVEFTVSIRIPGWCDKPACSVNGEKVRLQTALKKGYAGIKRRWKRGDRIELVLPMKPVRIEAHPAVRQDTGRAAIQRGPVVYCLEETDNGKDLNDITVPADTPLTVKTSKNFFKGVPVITARGSRRKRADWKGSLYMPAVSKSEPVRCTAVPYFMWANRKPGEMLVWIRT
jgi:hypothetical protein